MHREQTKLHHHRPSDKRRTGWEMQLQLKQSISWKTEGHSVRLAQLEYHASSWFLVESSKMEELAVLSMDVKVTCGAWTPEVGPATFFRFRVSSAIGQVHHSDGF